MLRRVPAALTDLILALMLYFAMEWLFYVTKPSFLSGTTGMEKYFVFTVTPLLPVLFAICIATLLFSLTRIAILQGLTPLVVLLVRFVAAAIITATLFLWIENITYSGFRFSVFSLSGTWRLAYGVILTILTGVVFYKLNRLSRRNSGYAPLWLSAMILFLVGTSFVSALFRFPSLSPIPSILEGKAPEGELPDVYLIATDGLRADRMSAYGYKRDTTPFIRSSMNRMLIAENAFANTNRSSGSIVSMMTSEYPASTRVINYPDLVRGDTSYQNLGKLLEELGYRSLEISARNYADSFDLNLREAFQQANFRNVKAYALPFVSSYKETFNSLEFYFAIKTFERLRDRVFHAFGLKSITPAYARVTHGEEHGAIDSVALSSAYDFIRKTPGPLFIHLHLFGTHGPRYSPSSRIFSKGQEQTEDNMEDFYDDAVRDFDEHFRKFLFKLGEYGRLDKALIVLHSDHDRLNKINVRIPILFRFPAMGLERRISGNTQLMDIAPTILDFIGTKIPEWMKGRSLLSYRPERLRPIFTVSDNFPIRGINFKQPPFYNFNSVGAAICNRSYILELERNKMSTSNISGHTQLCSEEELPGTETVEALLLKHLRENDFLIP